MTHLGGIADDFTGATDLATNLAGHGFDVVVVTERGLDTIEQDPSVRARLSEYEAVVVALKTRTAPVSVAVDASLRALGALRTLGAERIYDKYCSTFDSTDAGNIGPILDALAEALEMDRTVVVPSFPDNGRTVRDGILEVHGVRLEDSSMRTHPLTPMTRSRVSELLRPQTTRTIAEIHTATVDAGAGALLEAIAASDADYLVVDATSDHHLSTIAAATADARLISGGSGLALGLEPQAPRSAAPMAVTAGRRLILAGSASSATQGQVRHAAERMPHRKVDVGALAIDPDGELDAIAAWAVQQPEDGPVLVHAVADPADVVSSPEAAAAVERLLSALAVRLVGAEAGFTRLVVAGGETSGAVVSALGLDELVIGPRIAAGVCWASGVTDRADTGIAVNVALKSGNFGDEDLFSAAWKELHA